MDGPDELHPGRSFALPPGDYRLVAAQYVVSDDEEEIDIFFEPLAQPLEKSVILVADDVLQPQVPLLETAEVAGRRGP